jgi:hypothetical protein
MADLDIAITLTQSLGQLHSSPHIEYNFPRLHGSSMLLGIMAREPKPQPNLTLADSIEAWGNKYGQSEDGYVSGLIAALRENKNLHIWATFDAVDYLPIPMLANGSKLARRVRFLTVLRNVLVFAPVALTWLAVGEATKGFQIYISQNTTGVANFLDFWQNGYDILPSEYRISDVARVDAVIILGVIALTLLTSYLGGKAQNQTTGGEAFADRERTALAIEIGLYLYDKQKPTASAVNTAVANSVTRLRTSTTALESSAKSLSATAKNLVSATKALDQSAKDIAAKKGKKVRQESSFDFDQFEGSAFSGRKYEAPKYEPVHFDVDNFEFGDSIPTQEAPKKKWKFR